MEVERSSPLKLDEKRRPLELEGLGHSPAS